MNIWEATVLAVKRVFDYKSRASRPEFWWFALVFFSWIVLAAVIDETVFWAGERYVGLYNIAGLVWTLFYIVGLVCLLPLSVRRLHDSDMSGFWVLIIMVPFGTLIFIYFMCRESTPMYNRFGHEVGEDDWALFD